VKVAVDILRQTNAFDKGNPFWAIREFDDIIKHDTLLLLACELEEKVGTTSLGILGPAPASP
jgi:hypothetical protein